jgi:aspartate/glutamate racemase
MSVSNADDEFFATDAANRTASHQTRRTVLNLRRIYVTSIAVSSNKCRIGACSVTRQVANPLINIVLRSTEKCRFPRSMKRCRLYKTETLISISFFRQKWLKMHVDIGVLDYCAAKNLVRPTGDGLRRCMQRPIERRSRCRRRGMSKGIKATP